MIAKSLFSRFFLDLFHGNRRKCAVDFTDNRHILIFNPQVSSKLPVNNVTGGMIQKLRSVQIEVSGKGLRICGAFTGVPYGLPLGLMGARSFRLLDELWICRDEMGARNMSLRALVDAPDMFNCRSCQNLEEKSIGY